MNKKKKNKLNNNKKIADKIDKSSDIKKIAFGTAPKNNVKTVSKKIYLKDEIKDKNYEELIKLIPMMVTIEERTYNDGTVYRSSFDVVGFGPKSIILASIGSYEYEPDVGDWGNTAYYKACQTVPFDKIDDSYIVASKPTEKQQKWLDDHGYKNQTISGYHAWHIIHDAVEEAKERAEERRREQEDYDAYGPHLDWDDLDMFDCPDPWGC